MSKARPRLVRTDTPEEAYYNPITNDYFPLKDHGGELETAYLACIAGAPPVPDWLTEEITPDGKAAFVSSDRRKWEYRDGDAYARRALLDFLILFRAPKVEAVNEQA